MSEHRIHVERKLVENGVMLPVAQYQEKGSMKFRATIEIEGTAPSEGVVDDLIHQVFERGDPEGRIETVWTKETDELRYFTHENKS
jgi:hypothetical protein